MSSTDAEALGLSFMSSPEAEALVLSSVTSTDAETLVVAFNEFYRFGDFGVAFY